MVTRIRQAFNTAISELGMKDCIAGLGVLTMTDNGPAGVQAFAWRVIGAIPGASRIAQY